MQNKKEKEYKEGFSVIKETEILAVLREVKREKRGAKNLLRVFAAKHEKKSLHGNSRVDLYRIINAKAEEKGIKRLSCGEIEKAEKRLNSLQVEDKKRTRAVSRVILRQVALGMLSTSETQLFLFYSSRRITEGKRRLQRLIVGERYARFKYRELQELSGLSPAKASEALARLKEKGILHTIEVKKQNENHYGQLFVDGWLISLVRKMVDCVKKVVEKLTKRERPGGEKGSTPHHKRERLRKDYPKNLIKKEKEINNWIKKAGEEKNPLFQRLYKKCAIMESSQIGQTA